MPHNRQTRIRLTKRLESSLDSFGQSPPVPSISRTTSCEPRRMQKKSYNLLWQSRQGDEIREREDYSVAWFYRLLQSAVIIFTVVMRPTQKTQGLLLLSDSVEMADPATERRVNICECINELIPALKPRVCATNFACRSPGGDVSSVADVLGITAGNAGSPFSSKRGRLCVWRVRARSCPDCASHGCLD